MKTIPVLSGGLDSVTMIYYLRWLEGPAYIDEAISFDYGQKHRKELSSATAICKRLGIRHRIVSLDGVLGGSTLTDPGREIPDGHYAAPVMSETVVPGRNLVMLSIAASFAERSATSSVSFGVHGGDHFIYPDCRPEFVDAARETILASTEGRVTVRAPFLYSSKAEIAKIAGRLGVPVLETWSCYKGGVVHCGTCGTCVERREAFSLADVVDPTIYAV